MGQAPCGVNSIDLAGVSGLPERQQGSGGRWMQRLSMTEENSTKNRKTGKA